MDIVCLSFTNANSFEVAIGLAHNGVIIFNSELSSKVILTSKVNCILYPPMHVHQYSIFYTPYSILHILYSIFYTPYSILHLSVGYYILIIINSYSCRLVLVSGWLLVASGTVFNEILLWGYKLPDVGTDLSPPPSPPPPPCDVSVRLKGHEV